MKKIFAVLTMVLMMAGAVAQGSQNKAAADVLSKAMEAETKSLMMLNDALDYFNNLPPMPVEDVVKAVEKAYPESAAAAEITVDNAYANADATANTDADDVE